MHGTYDFWMVALSLVIATLTSYTALDLSGFISRLAQPKLRYAWLMGGSAAMGIGIWSMHFIGMLAFSLPIPLSYDLLITSYSLMISIALSYCVLYIVTQMKLTILRLISSGTLMGLCIASMHYVGMEALQIEPGIHYDMKLFFVSIAIAIVAATIALWIVCTLNNEDQRYLVAKRVGAACVMGIAITGMHYTGMAAAHFPIDTVSSASKNIDSQWLATALILLTLSILIMTLIFSRYSVSQLDSQIVRLAKFDTLTDLPNRWTLMEETKRAIYTSRNNKSMFAILFIDLDGFKIINDSLGHSIGDKVLKLFAKKLLDCVRGNDMVARLGGDEFVVLLQNIALPEGAEKMAENVLTRMRQGLLLDGQSLQVMPSIGIAVFPQDGDTVEELMKHADSAMYEAKRGGRSTYRFFEMNMNEAVIRTLQIQRTLHEVLKTDYFYLDFQPKFHSNNREVAGAEALLRLRHPELGLISPVEFIPIAERSGQIVEIGYWVVRETCRAIRRWAENGFPAIKVAINLSPRQLLQTDLVAKIMDIVRYEQVPFDQIMFEITETVAMQDAHMTSKIISEFQKNNFDIAIDDFGTGYSSLAYLQRFRSKQLKIDRYFINCLDEPGNEGSAIVSAIINLAHSLEMDVVAEGVETASQLAKLQDMKCDEIQGFLLGKPMSANELVVLMQRGKTET